MEMEENKSIELKLSDMWEILKRCWWLMLIVCVVVGGFSFLFMKINHTPTYSSTATLYVVRESASGKDTTSSDISIATQLVRDFNKLISKQSRYPTLWSRRMTHSRKRNLCQRKRFHRQSHLPQS